MDKHYRILIAEKSNEHTVTNRADDIVGVLHIRSQNAEEVLPVFNTLLSDLSDKELVDIVTNFVRIAEKTAEYDKCGQSYYRAKEWLRSRWDNEDRNRYYGLRRGDIVNALGPSGVVHENAKVTKYDTMDNNRVYLKLATGQIRDWVAEWCHIVTKVEDL